jgi:alkylation response protein AidB-like acyl-CoA dehydrogenase
MPQSLLDKARALAPVIEREAAGAESSGTMTQPVVDALTESGLFSLMVPRDLGGSEVDVVTALEVLEEICRIDGSTGWSLLANVTSTAFAAAYCGDAAVKEMFDGPRPPIHAGQFAPRGSAAAVEGGYTVSGRYSFASGSDHAGYIAGGTLETKDREFVLDSRGIPRIRAVFVPVEKVNLLGNWDVMGLVATHSVDYEIPEQFVDAGWTFPLLDAEPQRGGAVYHLGVLSLTSIGHVAFALGVGKRALEEIVAVAKGKQRLGAAEPIMDQQLFQHELAMHDAAMRSARAYAVEVFGAAQAAVDSGDHPTPLETQRLRQATTYATRVAADATRFAYTWSGSDGLRNPSVLGRCFRDISAGTQHIFVDNNTLTDTAKLLLA